MDEIYGYALKLLARRDYSRAELEKKLGARFGEIPAVIFEQLTAKTFLNDRRFADNYAARRRNRGRPRLREELLARGVAAETVDEVLSAMEWPSLHEAAEATMVVLKSRPPLDRKQATRLFRALQRLGYEEDAIREEVEQLHEQ